jgi:hypothetical protein
VPAWVKFIVTVGRPAGPDSSKLARGRFPEPARRLKETDMRVSKCLILLFATMAVGLLLCLKFPRPRTAAQGSPYSTLLSPPPPEVEEVVRRLRTKRLLARRVIEEKVPLLEAAELFRAANGERGMRTLLAIPGRSERERLCRQVIIYVAQREEELKAEGQTPAEPAASVLLERELTRRMAAGEFPPEPQPEATVRQEE